MFKSKHKWISGPFTAVLVFLGLVLMFTALQRRLIYFPARATEQQQLGEAAALGLKAWREEDGSLVGWLPVGERNNRRMLVFHGNAGYALHRGYFVHGFAERGDGWDVYLFEYPGYGARSGSASEHDIKVNASRALELLLQRDSSPVYLLGESLGSGIASHLAAAYPERVAGLLLITPFTNLAAVAAHHYPWLPVRALLRERYDSEAALSHYGGPVAFLLAGRDEVVPMAIGRALYDGYGGPRWLRVESGAGHNSLPYHLAAPWWDEVSRFLLTPRAH